MVPANADHTTGNKFQKNNSTLRALFERLKFWKRRNEDDHKPARLKTLPKHLMHWTTPVWIAAAGFLIALALAANWRGTPHWPSADAMKLCATIAGAGFAFSAWQQRSHDNAVREQDKLRQEQAESRAREDREKQRNLDETRRLEQIERDEYWKRREHIFQLLGSKNPGLRLGAVALMAELADRAKHSTLLSNIENQQLQQHIIATLCSQLRHEGLAHETEGSIEEHASIQEEILNQLAKRIHEQEPNSSLANWQICNIDLSHTTFHTPFTLANLDTEQNIDISHSIFREAVHFTNSRLLNLKWSRAIFEKSLEVSFSKLYMDQFPSEIRIGKFETTRLNTHQREPILLPLSTPKDRPSNTNNILFTGECEFPDGLKIQTSGVFGYHTSEHIEFEKCSFHSLEISGHNFNAIIELISCTILEKIHIHDIDYQLGSVFTPDLEAIDAFFSHESEDGSEAAEWQATYPDYPYRQTASISFLFCNFNTVAPDNTITAHSIQAFDEKWKSDLEVLITFEDNVTHNGERIDLCYNN